MLSRIMNEIESAHGSININELKIKLGIERSALEAMIQLLVHSGYLVNDDTPNSTDDCSCGGCSTTCFDPTNYKLIAIKSGTKPLP